METSSHSWSPFQIKHLGQNFVSLIFDFNPRECIVSTKSGLGEPDLTCGDAWAGDSRASIESSSAMLDSLPAQIVILDENGQIVLTNLAWKEFAVSGNQNWQTVSEGVNYLDVCDQATGRHAEEAKRVATDIRRLMKQEIDDFQVKYECLTPQGRRWFLCRGRPYQGKGPTRVILIHSDITEYEQDRLDLEMVQNELARACRHATMGEMAAGLAHELKQPLGAIGLYVESCLEMFKHSEPPTEELIPKLELTASLTGKCSQIIDGLRGLIGHSPAVRHEVFDVRSAVRTVAAILQHDCRLAGIDFRLRMASEPMWMSGVVVQIQQVLLNLIRNAIEAQPDGGSAEKRIDVRVTKVDHEITFVIRDYGNGIPEEIRERLFEPFFTTKPKGIGMGLRISQAIVRAHGGRLTFDHEIDQGTSFKFSLPAQRVCHA